MSGPRCVPWRCSAAVLALVATATSPMAARAALPPVAPRQALVTLQAQHVVRARAGATRDVAIVAARRPITGTPTVLPLLASTIDGRGRRWHQVRLPGRANGERRPPRSGWILARGTTRSSTALHLVVDRAARRVLLYRHGRVAARFRAIVGAPSTPTPGGRFFVEEGVRMPAGAAGGPYALATSARSSVLYEFAGGPGQIALHGRAVVGGTLGTAVSHGCVRLSGAAITRLATAVGAGVPITIS